MSSHMLQGDSLGQSPLDFMKVVKIMDNHLCSDDLQSLKFLCQELVMASELERVDTTHKLIELLQSVNVSENNFFLLADLLQYIKRIDVLEKIGYDEAEVICQRKHQRSKVKCFYVLLFHIAEELTDEDLQKARCMYSKVPQSQKVSSGLDLFTVMIQHKAIQPSDVRQLTIIFEALERQDIVEMINRYVETEGQSVLAELEEACRRSLVLCGAGNGDGCTAPPQDTEERGRRVEQPVASTTSGHFSSASHPPSAPHPSPPDAARSFPLGAGLSCAGDPQAGNEQGAAFVAASENFDERVISWQMLDALAKKIPAEYWPEFIDGLGLHISSEWWDSNRSTCARNVTILKRWLDLPETQAMDSVTARKKLVHALHYAGPTLMAQEIAELLNVNISAILQESLSSEASSQNSETSSTSPATHIPEGNRNQTASAGETTEAQHLPRAANQGSQQNQEPSASPIQFYRMDRNPRGYCVIFNNREFFVDRRDAKKLKNREGTDVDKKNLKDTFEKLKFKVILKDNCTDTKMIQTMNQIAGEDNSCFDCFVCCILTHGSHGAVYGTNGMLVPICDLTSPFRSQACPGLAGKPKLFFLQACQGTQRQGGYSDDVQRDCDVELDSPPQLIPNEADFLLAYATVPGFVSYRSVNSGSWFINKLTDSLNQYSDRYDVLDILTLVNFEVGKENAFFDGAYYKQSPAPMTSMRKKLLFHRLSE